MSSPSPTPRPEIILRVKVPPGHVEGGGDEFTIGAIYTNLTIGAVRQRIQQLLPSNPAPERQRLLYAGRALVDNEQTLAEALNTKRDASQNEYVIHLLVKGEQPRQGGHARAQSENTAPPPAQPPQQGSNGHGHVEILHNITPQQAQHLAFLQQRQMAMHHQMMQAQQAGGQQRLGTPPMPVGGQPVHVHQHGHHHHHDHAQVPQQHAWDQRVPAQQPGQQSRNGEANAAPTAPPQQAETQGQAPQPTNQPPPQGLPTPVMESNQHQHQHRHQPGRPISGQGFHVQGIGPNGNRFEIHQQTVNIPMGGMPGQPMPPMPFGMPGMGLPFPMPGMAQPQHMQPGMGGPAANVPSALDRARQNVTEMRQMVEEMRTANASEEERARMTRMEEHINSVSDYIDPFRVGNRSAPPPGAQPPQQPQRPLFQGPSLFGQGQPGTPNGGLFGQPSMPNGSLFGGQANMALNRPLFSPPQMQPSNPSDTTCYLLSAPSGPQALLFSPQHGQYTGNMAQPPLPQHLNQPNNPLFSRVNNAPAHTPAPTQPAPAAQTQQDNAVAAPAAPAQPANAQLAAPAPAAQDALIAHFWLLFRVLIFAYFLLGTNMGWRRPFALGLIALGFYLIRTGLFGENGVARRWWEDIVRVAPPNDAAHPGNPAQGDGQGNAAEPITPEAMARRLLAERRAANPVLRAADAAREIVRPVERVVAMFVASLWPGVGEAHVRAREEEERRRNEAEMERLRVAEEGRTRAAESVEAAEVEKKEGGEGSVVEGVGSAVEGKVEASASASGNDAGGDQGAGTIT